MSILTPKNEGDRRVLLLETEDDRFEDQGVANILNVTPQTVQRDQQFVMSAISQIAVKIRDGHVQVIRFRGKKISEKQVSQRQVINYEVAGWAKYNKGLAPGSLRIYTSHFIGSCSVDLPDVKCTVLINIKPRFGDAVLSYLLQYTAGLTLLPSGLDRLKASDSGAWWLIVLLWKAALERALSTNHIPMSYVQCEENLTALRGRLTFPQHLTKNLVMKNRLFCRYSRFTADNVINRTVRYSYQLLLSGSGRDLVAGLGAYDEKLAAFGVAYLPVDPGDIDKIVYTRINENYRLFMEISQALIRHQSVAGDSQVNLKQSVSYFIDIAELWEEYIFETLRRNLPGGYSVTCPNHLDQQEVLIDGDPPRTIRPDILVWKGSKLVAILDAKYKRKERLWDVDMADIHQMTTYLSHYEQNGPLLGIFVCPKEIAIDGPEGELPTLHYYRKRDKFKIGLLHLNLPKNDELQTEDHSDKKARNDQYLVESCREFEKRFVAKLCSLIEGQVK